jgi:hypothetical protein
VEDLFGHSLVEVGAFQIFEIEQCLPEQNGIAFGGFLLLVRERVLQLLLGDQSLLHQIFPHAWDQHFRR